MFTGAEFNYAQAAVAVSISGLEMLQNSGENAIIDLLEGRVENAEQTLTNNIALDVYSNGKLSAVVKPALIDLEAREGDRAQAVRQRERLSEWGSFGSMRQSELRV